MKCLCRFVYVYAIDEIQESTGDANGKCTNVSSQIALRARNAYGLTNNGMVFLKHFNKHVWEYFKLFVLLVKIRMKLTQNQIIDSFF